VENWIVKFFKVFVVFTFHLEQIRHTAKGRENDENFPVTHLEMVFRRFFFVFLPLCATKKEEDRREKLGEGQHRPKRKSVNRSLIQLTNERSTTTEDGR
jgi:hypothetical protein